MTDELELPRPLAPPLSLGRVLPRWARCVPSERGWWVLAGPWAGRGWLRWAAVCGWSQAVLVQPCAAVDALLARCDEA